MSEEFVVADNLDEAWSNFDPFFTLPPDCIFHVEREGRPLGKLERALLRMHRKPPKYFFSGHRGCGKSTELNRLVVNKKINEKFFIVKFSVKDLCDVNNLNYVDVLFSIGGQLYIHYFEAEKKPKNELIDELNNWKNTIEVETDRKLSTEAGAGLDVKMFFLSFMAKIKSEDSTRQTIRRKIEPKLSDLIEKMNMIIAEIEGREKKKVLVIIDDIDKPGLELAKKIFYDNFTAITQPMCSIVYTVPISISYAPEFTAIRESKFFLPNIKLHIKNNRSIVYEPGCNIMKNFIVKRMKIDLIDNDAVNLVIKFGSGVFRETARIMQIAADNAIGNERNTILIEDVERAAREIRSDFVRVLKTEDYTILKEVFKDNEIRGIDKIGNLLHNLSILEYTNDDIWCDIHAVLEEVIKDGSNQ